MYPPQCNDSCYGCFGFREEYIGKRYFLPGIEHELDECSDRDREEFSSIGGSLRDLRNVESVDQNPIGKIIALKSGDLHQGLPTKSVNYGPNSLWRNNRIYPGFFSFIAKADVAKSVKEKEPSTVEMQFMETWCWSVNLVTAIRFKLTR